VGGVSELSVGVGSQATYLVCYYGTAGGASVGCDDNTSIVESTDDGGTGGCGLGKRHASCVKGKVAVVV
jgi:hypothetical protein